MNPHVAAAIEKFETDTAGMSELERLRYCLANSLWRTRRLMNGEASPLRDYVLEHERQITARLERQIDAHSRPMSTEEKS